MALHLPSREFRTPRSNPRAPTSAHPLTAAHRRKQRILRVGAESADTRSAGAPSREVPAECATASARSRDCDPTRSLDNKRTKTFAPIEKVPSRRRDQTTKLFRARRWEHHPLDGFTSTKFVTRLAKPADSYPIADVHVAAFYPRSLFAPLFRVDRVLSLMVCCICLPVSFRHGTNAHGGELCKQIVTLSVEQRQHRM
jgi:hypothetical protein